MKTAMKAGLVVTFVGALTACGGGDTFIKVQGTTAISKGQELTDLRRALDGGAINKQEYDRLYEKILERPN